MKLALGKSLYRLYWVFSCSCEYVIFVSFLGKVKLDIVITLLLRYFIPTLDTKAHFLLLSKSCSSTKQQENPEFSDIMKQSSLVNGESIPQSKKIPYCSDFKLV